MVLDGFDHHLVLQRGGSHLHAAGFADGRVRHIAIPANFIRGVHDDDPFIFGQNARGFTQHGGFADARFAQQQNAFAGFHQVLDDIDRAIHGAADAAGETNNGAVAVADGRNAVQGAFEPGAVIGVEFADA